MRCHFAASLRLLLVLLLVASMGQARKNGSRKSYIIYVGTYTGPNSKGIYAYRFDPATGQATPVGLVAETVNPSFLAIDPSQRFLYAANEISDYQGQKEGGKKRGAISAFAIDRKSGRLTLLNQVSSHGGGPCYVSLDQTGKYVLAANYEGGSVAVFPVLKDGRLGVASAVMEHTGPTFNPLVANPTRSTCPATTASRSLPTWGWTSCCCTVSTQPRGPWRQTIPPSRSFIRAQGRDTSTSIPTTSFYTYWKKRLPKSTDFPTMRQTEPCNRWRQFQPCPKVLRETIRRRKSRCTLMASSFTALTAVTTASPSSKSTPRPACPDFWMRSQPVARSRATLKSLPAAPTW